MADVFVGATLRKGLLNDPLALGSEIELTATNDTTVTDRFTEIQTEINSIIVPTPPSFRPFRVFTGGTLISNVNFRIEGITIDGTNLNDWDNINSIYAAGRVNKNVEIELPTDAEITTSGLPYPIAIEVTHMGGLERMPSNGSNQVILEVKSTDTARVDTVNSGTQTQTSLRNGDIVVLVKNAAGENWLESRRASNPSENLLPAGVFDLQEDLVIDNITNFSTLLTGRVITSGQGFLVTTGGTYFGGVNIPNGSALVAATDNPALTDVNTNDDWLVVTNAASAVFGMDDRLLLSNFARNGIRWDAGRNVFINEENILGFNGPATGIPLTLSYFDSSSPDATARTRTFTNSPVQFVDLVGGNLTLSITAAANSFSGFLPELLSIVLDYGGGISFTFPLTGLDAADGATSVTIQIPNADYSAALNSNCTITLNYNYRGATFIGNVMIMSLINMREGPLNAAVSGIANSTAQAAEQRIQRQINQVQSGVSEEEANFAAIQDRLMRYRTESQNTPEQGALFLDSTGVDSFPTDLATMTAVNPNNPQFTAGNTFVYVAVPVTSSANFALVNVTQDTVVTLVSATPTVTLGASLTFNNQTYFIYRVSGITINDVLEVDRVSQVRVVAERTDIATLQHDVAELQQEQQDIPDALRNILENEISVAEQTTPTFTASAFNNSLGSSGTQKVFFEQNPQTAGSGSLNSDALSSSPTNRLRRKLVFIGQNHQYGNANLIVAFDGSATTTPLVRYQAGQLQAARFIPGQAQGSTTVTVYPSPATRVAGAGIWQNIPALIFRNGVPVPEADELFFTRDVPSQATTLTIQYRGHANGNIFGTGTTTLANVGGSNETATTFNISDGSETATVEVRYYPNFHNGGRQIRVSVTERVNTGLPTINDVQVILSYSETRTVPATSATVRYINIESQATTGQSNVIAFKASAAGSVVVVGTDAEVDTGYAYTTVFGSSEGGHLTVFSEEAVFYDYENIEPTQGTVLLMEQHSDQPNFGMFDTTYNHDTVVTVDTQLRAHNSAGDVVNLGQEMVLIAPNGNRYRATVDNAGVIMTTQVT